MERHPLGGATLLRPGFHPILPLTPHKLARFTPMLCFDSSRPLPPKRLNLPHVTLTIRRFSLALAGLLLVSTGSLSAQASTEPAKPVSDFIVPFSHGYFTVGSMGMDVSSLNAHFNRTDIAGGTGFSSLSNDAYSYGVGGYVSLGRVMLGGEWHYGDFGYETSPKGKTNRLETSYLMATAAMPVYTTWRLTIFPFLGIGGGNVRLSLKNRDGGGTVSLRSDPTFDEIILNPGLESQILGNYLMVQPGIGVDWLLLKESTSHTGFTVGLRFGSAITPNRTTWTYRGHEVFGGPDLGPTGGTLRVLMGFGGFKMAKN